MQLPSLSDTVRVDSGFVAGDEISPHYDPMIAKLIAQGPSREVAIQKLHSALDGFEIAGLITNIEFLKKVCENPAFISGDVETGFINKQKEYLMAETQCTPEVYAQAALGAFLLDAATYQDDQGLAVIPQANWGNTAQARTFNLTLDQGDRPNHASGTSVIVKRLDTGLFDITVDGVIYHSVAYTWNSHNLTLTSFLPHTRSESRLIQHDGMISMFHQGRHYRVQLDTPKWVEKALGAKANVHSVLAPMPCKVLRVEAKAGDEVKKDQILVVIESMKMETVIRSPQDGVISRVVHQRGVSNPWEAPASSSLIALGHL